MRPALEFRRILYELKDIRARLMRGLELENGETILAAIDDLGNTVTALETAATAVATEVASLKSGSDETALASLNSRVAAVVTTLQGLATTQAAPIT